MLAGPITGVAGELLGAKLPASEQEAMTP